MILIKHELKQGWKSLAIWTASIGFFIIICVFLYPEMKGEMEDMNEMFSSMGAFSSAFGMDRLNFGTLIGFYATECGNILGLGGDESIKPAGPFDDRIYGGAICQCGGRINTFCPF